MVKIFKVQVFRGYRERLPLMDNPTRRASSQVLPLRMDNSIRVYRVSQLVLLRTANRLRVCRAKPQVLRHMDNNQLHRTPQRPCQLLMASNLRTPTDLRASLRLERHHTDNLKSRMFKVGLYQELLHTDNNPKRIRDN